jgi:LysR family transcriptional regulator, glycine cleavage system transcriptional activator
MQVRDLPFLNGVKAFEVAARCGSFAGAAQELNVTPAAVSRMVRLLEDRLEVRLFERGPNSLFLTPAGKAYQTGLAPILDALVALTSQIKQHARPTVLTVGVGPTFAIRWLIPRLASFREVAPDIDVRITTGGIAAPFGEDWTCGIKLGSGRWSGLVAEELFEADLIPVCSARLARRLKTPQDLKSATLLTVAHARSDWPKWLRSVGLGKLPVKGPVFDYYGQALQAAADGIGVALGIRPYIDDDVRAGRLVAPFRHSVKKGSRWYLLYQSSRESDPALVSFRRWIVEEVRRPA